MRVRNQQLWARGTQHVKRQHMKRRWHRVRIPTMPALQHSCAALVLLCNLWILFVPERRCETS